jgi:hypothetical protein
MRKARFNSPANVVIVVILSAIKQDLLTIKQRQEIESRLANYNIPLQIFQMVAERCECTFDAHSKKDLPRGPKIMAMLAGLNDRSIILLKQMFLDCDDSFSNFRFAVFLSSRYSPMMHKFVMDAKLDGGKSRLSHAVDICIYSRQTEELVAVGMQNKDAGQRACNKKSLQKFLTVIEDICTAHPNMHGAYYASSYGYEVSDHSFWTRKADARKKKDDGKAMEIKLFEYKDKIYFESRSSFSPI